MMDRKAEVSAQKDEVMRVPEGSARKRMYQNALRCATRQFSLNWPIGSERARSYGGFGEK